MHFPLKILRTRNAPIQTRKALKMIGISEGQWNHYYQKKKKKLSENIMLVSEDENKNKKPKILNPSGKRLKMQKNALK